MSDYIRFKLEEELLKSVLHSLSSYDTYPRVSAIGGKKIRPDIDILEIERISENQYRLIGYELKLMEFDKRGKGLSWNNFYKGIGQALLYLKNGLHQVVLVLGFHEDVPNDKIIEDFHELLQDKKELLSLILGSCISLDVYLYERGSISPIIKAQSDFHSLDKEIELLRNELLQKKFTFDKKLKVK